MTPLVWVNLPLGLLFILAIVGIPMWMTFKRPSTRPDFSQEHAYLRAKEALERGGTPRQSALTTARLHAAAQRIAVPGRRHSGVTAERTHPARAEQRTRASA